jgi:hypothetical protein
MLSESPDLQLLIASSGLSLGKSTQKNNEVLLDSQLYSQLTTLITIIIIVCLYLIYGFRLPLWYLQVFFYNAV